ncbi:MAG: hypothetical protein WBF43_09375 [Methylocella sp.]
MRQKRWEGLRSMSQQWTVIFFNADKGYGFIKPDKEQRVSYEIEADKKGNGPNAVDRQAV